MPRKTKVTVNDIDGLNALLIKEFGFQLSNPPKDEEGNRLPIPAAALAVISKFILASGWRPMPDSPLADEVRRLAESLPFKSEHELVN